MSSLIRLNSTVVSHTGMVHEYNSDNFYVNGRFKHDYENNNIQVSVEENSTKFVFGVCDGMKIGSKDESTSLEMIKSLNKYDEQVMSGGGDVESKIDLLCDSIEETNNIFYSKGVTNPENKNLGFAFSGLIIAEGKAAAINIGDCSAILLRDGVIKHITNEHERANKLLKMGILSDEQAQKISGKKVKMLFGKERVDTNVSDSIKLKEEDVYLLCSKGLTSNVDENKIQQILESSEKSDEVANKLIKEARKNFVNDNITVLVIRVERITNASRTFAPLEDESKVNWGTVRRNGSDKISIGNIIKGVAAVIVLGSLLALGYISIFDTNKGDIPIVNSSANPDVMTFETSSVLDVKAVTYTIKEGDTLESISKKFYNDPSKSSLILDSNQIKDVKEIKVGQILNIYPEEYIIRAKGAVNSPDSLQSTKTVPTITPAVSATPSSLDTSKAQKYTIQPGDTPETISKKFYNNTQKYDIIMKHNNISNYSTLKVGQEIEIPPLP